MPGGANDLKCHTSYMVEMKDDVSHMIKAKIALHGIGNDLRIKLSADSTICPHFGFHVLEYTFSLMESVINNAYAKTAFFQSGNAKSDAFFDPLTDSAMKITYMWLLLNAPYVLVHSNAKWQVKLDQVIFDLGPRQGKQILQLFYLYENGKLFLIVSKAVNDLRLLELVHLQRSLLIILI